MVNVAPVAVEAGLAEPMSIVSTTQRHLPSPRSESPEEIVSNVVKNEIVSTSRNSVNGNRNSVRNITMEEMGMEPTGLATKQPSFEHLRNDDIINGEDMGVAPSVSTKYTSMYDPSTTRISGINIPESAIKKNSSTITAKDIEDSSLRQPMTSVSNRSTSGETTSSLVVPSQTSDTIPIRTKGGNRGGSIYGIMSQSAYRLAPAAVLLATAAAIMKKSRRHKRIHHRKTRRSRR